MVVEVEDQRVDFGEKSWLDWLVGLQSPAKLWNNHGSYLALELVLYVFGALTLAHAIRHGGRYVHIWVAALLHAFNVELITYYCPDIDNFWHAQSMTVFFGRRFPVHIMLFYPCLLYTDSIAISRLKLPFWAQPFLMGILDTLLDLPFDIMGIKMCWWTWHDTDPNIGDRHYWVPWTSYFFHASFAVGFHTVFFGSRWLLSGSQRQYDAAKWPVECLCTVLTALLAMPVGVVQFVILYHPLHDLLNIHTEVVVAILFAIFFCIVWSADRHPPASGRAALTTGRSWLDEVSVAVILWYTFYLVLTAFFAQPEEVVASGIFETVGPCNETVDLQTAAGIVLSKRRWFCPTDYDEQYFDWHCRPGGAPPSHGVNWYTICGTPFPNKAEYVVVVTSVCLFGLFVFYQLLARSGLTEKAGPLAEKVDKAKRSRRKQKQK